MVFLHFLLKIKLFDEFFPFQNIIANLSLCVASVGVRVCVHPLNKDSQAIIGTFFQCISQNKTKFLSAALSGTQRIQCVSMKTLTMLNFLKYKIRSHYTVNWTPRAGPRFALLPLYDSLKDGHLFKTDPFFLIPARGIHLRDSTK